MINDSIFRRLLAYLLSGGFGDFIERKLLNWQKDRAKKKARSITGEDVSLIIEDHILKFHHHDRRRDFSEKWFKTYGENVKLNDERFLSLWR